MPKSSPEQINRSFSDKLTPEAKEAYQRVNEPEKTLEVVGQNEETMARRAEMNKGETLLENTLALIENGLRKKTNEKLAKQLLAELRQDGNRLAAIKQELLENIGKNQGDDKRADVAGRIANELIAQAV